VGRTVELGCRGQAYRLTVATVGRDRYRVTLDDRFVDVDVDRLSPLESRLTVGDDRFSVVAVQATGSSLVEVDGVSHRVSRDVGGIVRAPAPAVVVAVRAAVGQEVEAGQTIVVLESMKMETAVRAPFAGRVREVRAAANAQVDAGAPLLTLDRAGGEAEDVSGERVTLPEGADATAPAPRARALATLAALQALITGYDIGAGHVADLVREYADARADLPPDDPELLRAELAVLTTFADLAELSRNRPAVAEEEEDQQVHSPREYFHTYLHSLDAEREGLPAGFRDRLRRALAHYGVDDDRDSGPALEAAVYRVFLAQQRVTGQLPAVLALLDRWLVAELPPSGEERSEVAEVLDRLVVATQLRYPSVGDLARAVRYRSFEEPVVRRARQEVLDEAGRLLDELDEARSRGESGDDLSRIETLVASPEPLIRLLAQRFHRPTSRPDPIVEVLTRRYYRSRALRDVRSFLLEGQSAVSADYELNGMQLHVLALMVGSDGLSAALPALAARAAESGDPGHLILDLYLSWPDRPADDDAMAAGLQEALAAVPGLQTVRRVTVTVCTPDGDVDTVTFRPSADGLAEERIIRGLHPLTAQRLDLWRLKEFEGRRLPSAEDTYLLHVVAKDNPADERLIAMAEVRDLTPVRDETGEIVGFPTVERLLTSCLDGLRRAQSQRSSCWRG
jgi:biotin carboxyl carrier protein